VPHSLPTRRSAAFLPAHQARTMSILSAKSSWGVFVVGAMFLATTSCDWRHGGAAAALQTTTLTIKGSDTMVHLVSAWAEAFMQRHPNTEISVTGGGSGTGFAALLNRTTDICAASRDMLPREIELAKSKEMNPVRRLVARDGIAIIVHPSNPVATLTMEQLRKIYTGAYDNWSQVGGADKKIVVYSRDNSSGTFVYFQEHVLLKRDYRSDARMMPATSIVVQSVSEDDGAIGYVGLGYAVEAGDAVKVLAIRRTAEDPAVLPSAESVRSGEYSIARPLRLFTAEEPKGLAAKFIEFCLGQEGQEIVRETGYVAAN
jgi:phosphate transport system substrate-binding protein